MKRVNVYYLVDTSGGMCGDKIGIINASMEEVIPLYLEIEKLTGASIYLQVMQYGSSAKWLNEKPISLDEYIWNDMQAGGLADLGQALKLLKIELENIDKDIYPVIIHLAYCSPTDNWEPVIEQLEEADSYGNALRMVVNIEGAFDEDVAFRFTKDFNNIMNAKNGEDIKKKIVNGIKNFFYNQDRNCLNLSVGFYT